MRKSVLFVGMTTVVLVLSQAARSEICKYVDADGNLHYTRIPPEKGWKKLSCGVGMSSTDAGPNKSKPREAVGAGSTDALIVLTAVGYLTGAADDCKVVPDQSNALTSGISLAIGQGNYGNPAESHILFNNARQRGITDAAARKVDCLKIAESVRRYTQSLLSK